jgi:hypothetical protein
MTKVNSTLAWSLIIFFSAICALTIYLDGLAYYADKTAAYTAIGNAFWAERNLIIQQRHSQNIDGAAHISS